MTENDETNVVPEEPTASPGQQAYNDAYNTVVQQHVMQPVSFDSTVRCSCGDTGPATDMAGHMGDEARRAGEAARQAVEQ